MILSTFFADPTPTLTVDNVSHVMKKVESKVKILVWKDACAAEVKREKMMMLHTSGKEDECADLYVNYDPYCSWEYLARSLYHHNQMAAVEEVRSYLPPRGERQLHVMLCEYNLYFWIIRDKQIKDALTNN